MGKSKVIKKVMEDLHQCYGLESGTIFLSEDITEGKERYLFVCRNFNVGDRVKVYYKMKLVKGTVQKKEKPYVGEEPILFVKTDEKVGEDNHLYEGYGLKGPIYGRDTWLFEWEKLPEGDEIYRTIIERTLTKEELEKEKQFLDDIPF